ncbi:MAG: hypothetical protein AcusKO_16810 [Acuticoccus sp.]
MSEAQILSFGDAQRARGRSRPPVLDLEVLKGRQPTVSIADCHAALSGVSVVHKMKTREVNYFHDLSVAFPRGRKIAILGHREVGQQFILELLTRRLAPTLGTVHINSRISWMVPETRFFEVKGSLRENMVFFGRIMGVDPKTLMQAALSIGELPPQALREPVRNLPNWAVRRIGVVLLYFCDFDLHLVGRFQERALQFDDEEDAAEFMNLVYGRDYIAMCEDPKNVPDSCNLLYLLYEGVLYQFEDIMLGKDVFDVLPKPATGPRSEREKDDEFEEDDELREDYF